MQLRTVFSLLGPALRHGPGAVLLAGLAAAPLGAAPEPESVRVIVQVEGLRNLRGQVLACLTTQPRRFPDCRADTAARKLMVRAADAAILDFGPVPDGRYAISLLHDENSNGKADMVLMIPREGFGFSRNAPVRMGPPSFASAAFAVSGATVRETIRMRYMI